VRDVKQLNVMLTFNNYFLTKVFLLITC